MQAHYVKKRLRLASFFIRNSHCAQTHISRRETQTFIMIGSVVELFGTIPRRRTHRLGSYQWSSADVVIQFAAGAHDDNPARMYLQRFCLPCVVIDLLSYKQKGDNAAVYWLFHLTSY